jgi:hypothetical protein
MLRLAIFLLTIAACELGDERDCTKIGCPTNRAVMFGEFEESDLVPVGTQHAALDLCMNTACINVILDALPRAREPVNVSSFQLSRSESGRVEITFFVGNTYVEPQTDGDVYRLKLTASDGRVLADRSWEATYTTSYPNGPDCGPACRTTTTVTEL